MTQTISTHAPLAGRDWSCAPFGLAYNISTHAPLAGRDSRPFCKKLRKRDFNPRAPCGARRQRCETMPHKRRFQPTRPLRGATLAVLDWSWSAEISTHAPLAGRDQMTCKLLPACFDFNPRAPCGARQQKCTNHYAHFCDNRQISDAFAQNAACQGILLLFDAGKPCGFWVRTAQVISAHLCFAL